MAEDTFSRALRAWHGSPHDFDEFQDKAIGTGEGTQSMGGYGVYGHGHYATEVRSVGEGYRNRLHNTHNRSTAPKLMFRGSEISQLHRLAKSYYDSDNKIANAQKEIDRVKGQQHESFSPGVTAENEYLKELREDLARLKGRKEVYEDALKSTFPEFLKENHSVRDYMVDILGEIDATDPLGSFSRFQDSVRNMYTGPGGSIEHNPVEAGSAWEDAQKAFKTMLPLIHEMKMERPEQKEGRLYELNLNVEPSELLLWDDNLEDHPKEVSTKILNIPEIAAHLDPTASGFDPEENDAFDKFIESRKINDFYSTGEDIYKFLVGETGSAIKASNRLLEHGIRGIKYEDQQSRGDRQKKVLYDGNPLSDSGLQEVAGYLNDHHFDDNGKLIHDEVPFRAQHIREVGERRKKLWEDSAAHRGDGTDMYGRTDEYWKGHFRVAKALEDNPDKFTFELPPKTYNYVIFDPRAIRILRKYGMKNELVKDFIDTGVHVNSVNHDPFEKE